MSFIFPDHSTDNMGTSTISDHMPATLHHKSGEPSATANENKPNWKLTASATAKLGTPQMPLVLSNPSPEFSALFLKIARYKHKKHENQSAVFLMEDNHPLLHHCPRRLNTELDFLTKEKSQTPTKKGVNPTWKRQGPTLVGRD